MIRIASKIWMGYLNALNKNPWRVQIIQTGILMSSGDLIAQCCLENVPIKNIDWSRTARFGAIGCIYVGPVVRTWYLTMERIVGSGVTIQKTLTKVALDQLGMAPVFTVGILTLIGLFQGQNLQNIKTKLNDELMDIVINGWKIWPASQLINFYFVPFLLRPLVVSIVALFWNTYLAWRANRTVEIKS